MSLVTKKYQGIVDKALTGRSPMSAIHANCLICLNCATKEIKNCTEKNCIFWIYRPYQDKPYRLHNRRKGGIYDRYVRGEKGQILQKKAGPVSKDIVIPNPHTERLRVRIELEPENGK